MWTYWASIVNQLNEPLTDSLTYWGTWNLKAFEHLRHLRHSRHSGTRRARGHTGTQGTWALGHLRHSGTRRALGHSGIQDIWALGLSGTLALGHSAARKVLGHLGTWTLRHSGTWAFEALYLADSNFGVQFYLRARDNKFHFVTCYKYIVLKYI